MTWLHAIKIFFVFIWASISKIFSTILFLLRYKFPFLLGFLVIGASLFYGCYDAINEGDYTLIVKTVGGKTVGINLDLYENVEELKGLEIGLNRTYLSVWGEILTDLFMFYFMLKLVHLLPLLLFGESASPFGRYGIALIIIIILSLAYSSYFFEELINPFNGFISLGEYLLFVRPSIMNETANSTVLNNI